MLIQNEEVWNLHEVLLHYWSQFLLLLPRLAIAAAVVAVAVFIALQLSRLMSRKLRFHAADPLLVSFLAQVAKWVLILAGLMLAFSILGLTNIAGGLIAGAGVSALVFGFAFKDIGENFLAGIILAFNRPFHIKDTISVGPDMGQVVAMGLRTTRVKTFDGRDVYIPNSVLMKSTLTNYTADGLARLEFPVNVALKADTTKVRSAIVERLQQLDCVQQEPLPFVSLEALTATALTLKVHVWVQTFDYSKDLPILRTRAMQATKEVLLEEGLLQST